MSAPLDLLNYCGLNSKLPTAGDESVGPGSAYPHANKSQHRLLHSIKRFFKPNDQLRSKLTVMNGTSQLANGDTRPDHVTNKPQVYVVGSPNPKSSYLRIAHVSDTCDCSDDSAIFNADVLVHSGNLCNYQFRNHFFKDSEFLNQLKAINEYFERLPHRYKIFVPGPNEIFFDTESSEKMQALLPSCIYLQDSGCVIEGVKFYGIPWSTSRRGTVGRGFSKSVAELKTVWSNVPDDIDVLISHSMPTNSLYDDLVNRLRPKMFLYGSRQQRSSRSEQGDENSVKFKDNIIFSNGHAGNASRRGIFDFYPDEQADRMTILPEISPEVAQEAYQSTGQQRGLHRCILS